MDVSVIIPPNSDIDYFVVVEYVKDDVIAIFFVAFNCIEGPRLVLFHKFANGFGQ